MSFNLSRRAGQWNAIGRTDRRTFASVRHAHTERVCCQLMSELDASELRVLLAIQARTLRFNKFAEAISMSQFCLGLRDEDGDLILDDGELPYFAGCNIAKTETASHALSRLEAMGQITRWRLGPRSSPVYMPFAENWLVSEMLRLGGPIAQDYEFVVLNEYYSLPDGRFFRVIEIERDRRVVLEPVSARLGYRDGDSIAVAPESWSAFGLRRLTVQQIMSARQHRSPD